MKNNLVEYKKAKHLIDLQHEKEKSFLQDFTSGNYTLDTPLIIVNPYIIAPLCALIMFRTNEKLGVELTVFGKESAGNIVQMFPASKEHYISVLGLYANCETIVQIKLSNGDSSIIKVTTETLPKLVKSDIKIDTTAEYMSNNLMFVTPTAKVYAAGYDYKGDCRWCTNQNLTFDLKQLNNGRIIIGTERLLVEPYIPTGLYEMGMIGKIYKEYRIAGVYHHDQYKSENENLLMLTNPIAEDIVEDICVLIFRESGAVKKMDTITAEVKNDVLPHEMHLPANYYRAKKIPLYRSEDKLMFGKGQLLGGYGVTETQEGMVDLNKAIPVNADMDVIVLDEIDLIHVSAVYEEGIFAQIILVGENGEQHLYSVTTVSRNFQAMYVGSFQKNAQLVERIISKEGLNGKYKIYIKIENTLFDTHCKIECE